MRPKIGFNALLSIVAGAFAHAPADAVETKAPADGQAQLETVVVTAQRRAEDQQKVPIEIHAMDAATAQAMGITDTQDLGKLIPGLTYMRNTTNGLVFLRGVGSPTGAPGTESPVAIYMDGVYLASMSGNMFSLSGIERVEAANGPQGTLFGRNALGGAIQIVTKDPSSTASLDSHVGFGNYGTYEAGFYGTNAITDTLAGNVSFDYRHQDEGWGRNLFTGQDVYRPEDISARTKLLWTPDDKTSVSGWLYFGRLKDSAGAATALMPGSVGGDRVSTSLPDFYDVNENQQSGYTNKQWIASIRADHDFSWARITSISAYADLDSLDLIDLDATPSSISEQNPNKLYSRTITQELQLASLSNAHISWIGGLYYYHNASGVDPARVLGTGVRSVCGATCTYYDINTRPVTYSIAGYAQATAPLTEDLRLTAGVRFTRDNRHIRGQYDPSTGVPFAAGDQEKSWNNVSYRIAFDYDLTDAVLAYVSYSTGFNSGYFNGGAPAQPPVNPAKIGDVEGGVKAEFFDHRVRLNLSGFHYDYDNIVLKQVTSFGTIALFNAATARIYGADASFDIAATSRLTIQGAMEALHAKFTDFPGAPLTVRQPSGINTTVVGDLSGTDMFMAPAFTATLGAQYEIPSSVGQFLLAASYQYNDGFNWQGTANADGTPNERIRQPSFNVLSASLQWTASSERWGIRVWGKNITGEEYYAYGQTNGFGDTYSPAPPATYGVSVSVHL